MLVLSVLVACALGRSVAQPRAGGKAGAASVGEHAPHRAGAAAAPSVRELVGQRFIVAIGGTTPSAQLLTRVRRGEIGGVILFGANTRSPAQLRRLTATLQRAARLAGRPPLLIATDQEGGKVRRLPWAGPALAAPALGRLAPSRIQAEAEASGKLLRRSGVNVDLAPVADVAAAGSFMALERRTFGTSPGTVAAATAAFARGLAAARVAATVKHFPGIGRATRNTDASAVAIRATAAELSHTDLRPFRAAVAAGAPIVMVANATYPDIDAKPAAWSPRIQALLRRDLGFAGVTMTDALDGAATTRGRSLPSVATLAAQSGIDLLLLTGSESSSGAAFEHVTAVAAQGGISPTALEASYDRILALKGRVG